MSQPRLEAALRDALAGAGKYCVLRPGCEVIARLSIVPPVVEYMEKATKKKTQLKGMFLVGADGKTGIVRKHFLEPEAGIRQLPGVYPYEGTWVASNFAIRLPTAGSHPDFPLWKHGYTPDEVYDLFWPKGWHFASPPGRPTATGRFGPHNDRTWRHEFKIEESEKYGQPMYSEELLWQHLAPNITQTGDRARNIDFGEPVCFPRDCIEILRCRPFAFTHKCVNKWFHESTMLVGDAAHVFPPFAGQGVASGMRDAHQLAWRLALAVQRPDMVGKLLAAWAAERDKNIQDAAMLSRISGFVCNNKPPGWFLLLTKLLTYAESNPSIRSWVDLAASKERVGFSGVEAGFFLKKFGGGFRLAQIHLQPSSGGPSIMSDALLRGKGTVFTLLVISNGRETSLRLRSEAVDAIKGLNFDQHALSENSVVVYNKGGVKDYLPTSVEYSPLSAHQLSELGFVPVGYDSGSYLDRLVKGSRYVLLRPDMFVFACARGIGELRICLEELKEMITEA